MTRREALQVLGLSTQARDSDVKSAYRELALACHPDTIPSDAGARNRAEDRLKQINLAYEALKKGELELEGQPAVFQYVPRTKPPGHTGQLWTNALLVMGFTVVLAIGIIATRGPGGLLKPTEIIQPAPVKVQPVKPAVKPPLKQVPRAKA